MNPGKKGQAYHRTKVQKFAPLHEQPEPAMDSQEGSKAGSEGQGEGGSEEIIENITKKQCKVMHSRRSTQGKS